VNGASGCRKAIRRSLNVETPDVGIHADVLLNFVPALGRRERFVQLAPNSI
jgi:hypothetical protein